VSGYGTIMTGAQAADLKKLQAFLEVDQETVDGLHRLVCAPAYQQVRRRNCIATAINVIELCRVQYAVQVTSKIFRFGF
jgi:hypothetical protein